MVPHSLDSRAAGLTKGDERVAKASRNRAAAARARLAEQRAQEARRKRRRNWIAGISAVVVVIIAAVGITLAATSGGSSPARTPGGTPQLGLAPLSTLGKLQAAPTPGRTGPEGVPIPAAPALASTSGGATGSQVDGISCQTTEQLLFHIHAHLTVFVNGSPRQVPAGIGIPGAQAQDTPSGTFITGGTCLYWLHTHAADGIIHIESPVRRTFTLGQVFNEWGQPLGTSQVGPAKGQVTALYNGKVYRGNPRNIPLNAHAQIQLEVGKPLVAPESITFPNGL
jgi:type II secretory pathway pseudopilin PulG